MKRFLSFALTLLMLVSCVSCDEPQCQHADNDYNGVCDLCGASVPVTRLDYSVTVKDGKGDGISGVIVKIYAEDASASDEPLAMKVTKSSGVTSFKLDAANYKVRLYNTKNEELEYDKSSAVLTEAYPDVNLTVYDKLTDKVGSMVGMLYSVDEGSYFVEFKKDELSYFVFIPKRTGVYKISVVSDTQVDVGNYGNPYNILSSDVTSEQDRIDMEAFKITVNTGNLGGFDGGEATNYTIGVKGRTRDGIGALVVERIDDVQNIPHTTAPAPKDLPESDYRGGIPEDIDITVSGIFKKYAAVYNENDGYYHLCTEHENDSEHICDANGPVIYLRLASDDALINFEAMIDAGNGIACYIYDNAGNVLERKDYTAMMEAYIEASDATYGVYALTEELREAVQNYGIYKGWFDKNNPDYLFGDKVILSNYKGSEFLAFCCFGD